MRALVLLALMLPALADAKYEGTQPEREPITIAIVFESEQLMIFDAPAEEGGLFVALRDALDEVHRTYGRRGDAGFIARPPAGSDVVLIGYDVGARVFGRSALEDLRGASLGSNPPGERFGKNLVTGVELALTVLARSPHTRRALIVIGDGDDRDRDRARAALASFQDRASASGVRTYGLRYLTATSSGETLFPLLTRDWERADPLAEKLPALITRIVRAEPHVERPAAVRHEAPPLPWFWFGVGAVGLAVAVALWLARPRAQA